MPDLRDEFMAAVVRLADNPEFCKSFLDHYHLWLHPPLIVAAEPLHTILDRRPGAVNYVSKEELDTWRRTVCAPPLVAKAADAVPR